MQDRSLTEILQARRPSRFFERFADFPGPSKRYMIATTARSGSTFLCSRMAEYGTLGYPNEFLNESYIAEFDRLFPEPNLSDFENFVLSSFTTPNGVFGFKTDFWRFRQAMELGFLKSLHHPIDLVIFLKRDDFVSQAISLALAVETNIWHGQNLPSSYVQERHMRIEYNPVNIKHHARNILNQEFYWRKYIIDCGVDVFEVTYESISDNIDDIIKILSERMSIKFEILNSDPIIEKSRSDIKSIWIERFHEECPEFIDFWHEFRGIISAQ
ncbi:Stf0 family sulfotransferase [Phenylobacterium sp.]|uniref:Stf0 family sulfotransferase n=1 Tax=Phenylobacterium sp. TaxID=1871053 RepID=UPI0025D8A7B3|nr:Stf0 family sulfotransferase [Phenylobacterium sp.]MCA3740303.1 hypothetical protein [Phenylobacterium sp.]